MLEGLPTETEKNGLLDKYRKPELSTRYVENWSTLTKKFLDTLPYTLTPSQLTAASEIVWDLKRAVPMNRLLQVRIHLVFICPFILPNPNFPCSH